MINDTNNKGKGGFDSITDNNEEHSLIEKQIIELEYAIEKLVNSFSSLSEEYRSKLLYKMENLKTNLGLFGNYFSDQQENKEIINTKENNVLCIEEGDSLVIKIVKKLKI